MGRPWVVHGSNNGRIIGPEKGNEHKIETTREGRPGGRVGTGELGGVGGGGANAEQGTKGSGGGGDGTLQRSLAGINDD